MRETQEELPEIIVPALYLLSRHHTQETTQNYTKWRPAVAVLVPVLDDGDAAVASGAEHAEHDHRERQGDDPVDAGDGVPEQPHGQGQGGQDADTDGGSQGEQE